MLKAPPTAWHSVSPEQCRPHGETGTVVQEDVFSEFTHKVQEELNAGQRGVRTSRIQFGLTATQFSYLWTIYIRQRCAGGCGTMV